MTEEERSILQTSKIDSPNIEDRFCSELGVDWNQSGLELQAPEFDPALYQDQPETVP